MNVVVNGEQELEEISTLYSLCLPKVVRYVQGFSDGLHLVQTAPDFHMLTERL